jgi:hypothetical protein
MPLIIDYSILSDARIYIRQNRGEASLVKEYILEAI